jgi:acylphosphatase
MMDMVARFVRVTGRVQGVFFRAWACDEARTLGVGGWVRNCSDGSVEAQLEGDAEAINELLDLIREGPPGARVDDLEVEEVDAEGLSSFEVRH